MKKGEGKKLTPPVLIALTVVGVLVFGLATWFALVRPQGGKIKQLKADQAEIQQQIDDIRAKTASARQAPKIHYADVYRLAKAMPDDTDMPDLVLELGQLARDTGIQFDSISPAPPASLGGYTVVPITVKFNGNFFNLADFLYRLRTLVDVHNSRLDATGRLFSVDTLTFSEAPQRFPMIQAQLLIDAFVYGNAVPGAAAGAAPATGATDTTSTSTTSTDTTSTTTTTSTEPTASASAAGAP
ncbi:MAG TPA: type 4a pilus biogenesis protein PilO [Gaiellaceae bacterium]|nr:type 4a pilus biogenesis protein PilO [Gaiellaceae bacterium]